MGLPGLLRYYVLWALDAALLNGLKTATSSGCILREQWGGEGKHNNAIVFCKVQYIDGEVAFVVVKKQKDGLLFRSSNASPEVFQELEKVVWVHPTWRICSSRGTLRSTSYKMAFVQWHSEDIRGQWTRDSPGPCPSLFFSSSSFSPFSLCLLGPPLAPGPLDIVHPCHPLATPLLL